MRKNLEPGLVRAVKEYYAWNGDRNVRPVGYVTNKKPGAYRMLLVRFTDENGDKISSLMEFQPWKDGHYDVTEAFFCDREGESDMVDGFVNSDEYL